MLLLCLLSSTILLTYFRFLEETSVKIQLSRIYATQRKQSSEEARMTNITTRSMAIVTLIMILLPTIAVSASEQVTTKDDELALTEPTLQEWFDANGYAINASKDELGVETFEAGHYQIEILAEIAGYASSNNLSWYPISTAELHQIFSGVNSTGDTAFFVATATFGLALGSPAGLFCTEVYRNPDNFDHAFVFANPNPPGGYIIVWEDLWEGGDKDYQDMILATLIPVIKAKVCICPHTLNLKSKGRWITAFIRLPEEYAVENIDISTILLNKTVPAESKPTAIIYLKCLGVKVLMVKFNRTAVIEYIKDSVSIRANSCKKLKVTLTVSGRLVDYHAFEGSTHIHLVHYSRCKHKYTPTSEWSTMIPPDNLLPIRSPQRDMPL